MSRGGHRHDGGGRVHREEAHDLFPLDDRYPRPNYNRPAKEGDEAGHREHVPDAEHREPQADLPEISQNLFIAHLYGDREINVLTRSHEFRRRRGGRPADDGAAVPSGRSPKVTVSPRRCRPVSSARRRRRGRPAPPGTTSRSSRRRSCRRGRPPPGEATGTVRESAMRVHGGIRSTARAGRPRVPPQGGALLRVTRSRSGLRGPTRVDARATERSSPAGRRPGSPEGGHGVGAEPVPHFQIAALPDTRAFTPWTPPRPRPWRARTLVE
jgi:hypothetical protein